MSFEKGFGELKREKNTPPKIIEKQEGREVTAVVSVMAVSFDTFDQPSIDKRINKKDSRLGVVADIFGDVYGGFAKYCLKNHFTETMKVYSAGGKIDFLTVFAAEGKIAPYAFAELSQRFFVEYIETTDFVSQLRKLSDEMDCSFQIDLLKTAPASDEKFDSENRLFAMIFDKNSDNFLVDSIKSN